jgi:hypothetical protein
MGKDAAKARREAGERMVEGIVANLGTEAKKLLAAYDPARPSRLRTFAAVERFWDEEIAPRLASFKSMRTSWYAKPAPDEGSRWRENWPVKSA